MKAIFLNYLKNIPLNLALLPHWVKFSFGHLEKNQFYPCLIQRLITVILSSIRVRVSSNERIDNLYLILNEFDELGKK